MKLYDFRKLEREGYYEANPEVYGFDALRTLDSLEEWLNKNWPEVDLY